MPLEKIIIPKSVPKNRQKPFFSQYCEICRRNLKSINSNPGAVSDADFLDFMRRTNWVVDLLLGRARDLSKSDYATYAKTLRLFGLIVSQYIEKHPALSSAVKLETEALLEKVKEHFGEVPILNPVITVSPLIKTKLDSAEVWESPSRSAEGGQRVGFMQVKVTEEGEERDTAAVRVEIAKEYEMDLEKMDVVYAYEAGTFERLGNMQIDHVMPSAMILDRQLELIEAMNFDPENFGRAVFDSKENEEHYILKINGKFVGTKKFFMSYHNALNNVWVLTPEANNRKRDQDPAAWLKKSPYFGRDFMATVPQINKRHIIYTVDASGKTLGDTAKAWFKAHHGPTLGLRLMSKWIEAKLVKQSSKLIARIAAARAGNPSAGDLVLNERKLKDLNYIAAKMYVDMKNVLRSAGIDSSAETSAATAGDGAGSGSSVIELLSEKQRDKAIRAARKELKRSRAPREADAKPDDDQSVAASIGAPSVSGVGFFALPRSRSMPESDDTMNESSGAEHDQSRKRKKGFT